MLLSLDPQMLLEYKRNAASLKDRSSFRNMENFL